MGPLWGKNVLTVGAVDRLFITFEGTEGSGKSVQARLLANRLRAAGRVVVETREPGGTPLGLELRQILLGRGQLDISTRAEALLMNASRAQLVETVIRPALERDDVVVCDRFADSTLAYQGAGRGLGMDELASVIAFATAGLRPQLTLLLDVPVEVGLARKHAQAQGNRFEAETLAFHARVHSAYRSLVAAEPDRWRCFDAVSPVEQVAAQIWDAVAARMGLLA
ncbi:MAG: dTMP kinase [Chloroflexi bacterium]|nr:dTMP kinase [Chloroflexota bacterium]